MNCPFCSPNKKHIIINDKLVFGLYNIRPGKNKGRCLVVPKRHISKIAELKIEELNELFQILKLVSEKINQYYRPEGINYGWNENKFAGQTVEHLHIHVLPRYKNDGFSHYHLFHREPKEKINLSDKKLAPLIKEMKKALS